MINLNNFSSINQDHGSNKVSNKYSFISTRQIVDVLEYAGWQPVHAVQSSTRKEENRGFQKHMIRFRQKEDDHKLVVNEIIPEIVLTSAHNASSSFKLDAGTFRCVCSNQMVVSDSLIAAHRILHKGYTDDKVLNAVYSIVDETPKMLTQIKEFQNIHLSDQEKRIFGNAALELISTEETWKKYDREKTVENVLSPRRQADKESTLWNTFNVVQEKLLKGGRFLATKGYTYHSTKQRAVKAIDKNVKLNKALWELTSEMLKLKA